MTAAAARRDRLWTQVGSALEVALFGRETRYVGKLYAGRIFIFAVLVLTVVLSLDAANHLGRFLSDQPEPGAPLGYVRLAHYLLLRGGYNLPAILPIAVLVGVGWTEFALAISRQRIMIFNSGQPALRSLAAALVVGLGFGVLQFLSLAYVRPASVEAQAVAGFRDYGPKFRAPAETEVTWISVEDAVIAARIAFTDPPSLRQAVIYNLTDDGTLVSIRTAARAMPEERGRWTLVNGTVWKVPVFFSTSASGGNALGADHFDRQSLSLSLDPLWVENVGIQPSLLPQSVLERLATADRGVQNPSTYRAAYQERFAAVFSILGMALLPAALGISGFLPGMGAGPLVRVIVWGIAAYFASSVISQLGTYGYLPALVSAWLAPILFVSAAVGVVLLPARLPTR